MEGGPTQAPEDGGKADVDLLTYYYLFILYLFLFVVFIFCLDRGKSM